MSTRSLTVIKDRGVEILCMYRHRGGYPDCHGAALAEFLSGIRLVQGLGGNEEKVANGVGCLAAQIAAYFKTGPGEIYLCAPGVRNCRQAYTYEILCDETCDKIDVRVLDGGGEELFSGDVEAFEKWCDITIIL